MNHFKQNRSVHLARRDTHFEQAASLLFSALRKTDTSGAHIADYEEILFLLRVARLHAGYSIREAGKNENDEQFHRFISLLAGNVKAILSMLNLKATVESSEDTIFSFLGENKASVALQAEEYQRRANDIVRCLHKTLKLAAEPYKRLKTANREALTKDELERYSKARDHFTEKIKEGEHRSMSASGPRKNWRL